MYLFYQTVAKIDIYTTYIIAMYSYPHTLHLALLDVQKKSVICSTTLKNDTMYWAPTLSNVPSLPKYRSANSTNSISETMFRQIDKMVPVFMVPTTNSVQPYKLRGVLHMLK